MEEIIASISRIIAEDNRLGEPARPAPATKPDILELTEVVDDDGSVRRVRPAAGPGAAAEEAPSTGARRIEPVPPRVEVATGPRPDHDDDRILSSATAEAAAAAFARLGSVPRERSSEGGQLLLSAAGRTLEDIVRDLLRPLLQAWLEAHLPGIVERLVREEITRVAGAAGLR